jgi:hypothetical protein
MTSSFSTSSSLSSLRGTKDVKSTLGVDASSVCGVYGFSALLELVELLIFFY